MNILGYSGLDASVRYAQRDPDLRPGEERMVQGLDSAAAIMIDGQIVAAAAEERFSGEKHTNIFPYQSIRYCLDAAGIAANQLNAIAHGFDYGRYAAMLRLLDADGYDNVLSPARQHELWQEQFDLRLPDNRFMSIPHHLAHGASAFFPSGFTDTLCVVCDGMGEIESLSVFAVRDGTFQLLDQHRIRDSLGILYGLVTAHLGFQFNADEYKTMGLAPYGDPRFFRDFFDSLVELRPNGRYTIHLGRLASSSDPHHRGVLEYLQNRVISRPTDSETLSAEHCNFAAAMQERLEQVLFHVIGYWRERTDLKNLCWAGGVALNCTFNGKLAQAGLFDQIYAQPAAGDDGTAVGAAFAAASRLGEPLSPTVIRALPFYGPGYTKDEILSITDALGDGLEIRDLGSELAAAEDAAAALAEDEVVAWFQGRMEYGPRALGNRSIIANPLLPGIKERLNHIVKLREGFRPFAPAVTAEHARQYFDYKPSPLFDYMLATCPVRTEWRHRLPGITHVDGSARMQTVDCDRNPLFHRVITCFGRQTGVYCVVNTSFNLRGQPIILSPGIAIETFRKIPLERLYLSSLCLRKRT